MSDERLNLTPHDFEVRDEGTIVLLRPCNDAARMWIDEHLYGEGGAPVQWWGDGVVIDRSMAGAIYAGIVNDDLAIDFQ